MMSRTQDPHVLAIDVLRSEIAAIAENIAGAAATVPAARASDPEAALVGQAQQITTLAEAVIVLRKRRSRPR